MNFELIGHLLVLGFAALVLLAAFVFVVIDMLGRVGYLKDKVPWLDRMLERRAAIGILLLVAIFLLTGDGYELLNKEAPPIPSGPTVILKSVLPFTISFSDESPTSLRRRTLKLADQVQKFLVERATNPDRPRVAIAGSYGPNPSDEEKLAIKRWQEYDQETIDTYTRLYRNLMVGIVMEYKNKGVPVGYLDSSLSQHLPTLYMYGQVGDWGDDLAQFRNLAYRVDPHDNLINIPY